MVVLPSEDGVSGCALFSIVSPRRIVSERGFPIRELSGGRNALLSALKTSAPKQLPAHSRAACVLMHLGIPAAHDSSVRSDIFIANAIQNDSKPRRGGV